MYQDEDDEKEDILKQLSGEVDDYAGSQLKDPNEPKGQGVTIEIGIKPHGMDAPKEVEGDEEDGMAADSEEHDPIAHILGMCSGGCPE